MSEGKNRDVVRRVLTPIWKVHVTLLVSRKAEDEESWRKRRIATSGGNITDKRSGGVFSYEGEIWTGRLGGWMEMEVEWNMGDKRFVELWMLKYRVYNRGSSIWSEERTKWKDSGWAVIWGYGAHPANLCRALDKHPNNNRQEQKHAFTGYGKFTRTKL